MVALQWEQYCATGRGCNSEEEPEAGCKARESQDVIQGPMLFHPVVLPCPQFWVLCYILLVSKNKQKEGEKPMDDHTRFQGPG